MHIRPPYLPRKGVATNNSISPTFHHHQGLTYAWSCAFDGEPCATADGPPLRLQSSPSIAIPSGTLPPSAPSRPYRFTVAVSKPGRVPASTSTTVHVRAAALPETSIAVAASATAFQSDGSVRCCLFNPSTRFAAAAGVPPLYLITNRPPMPENMLNAHSVRPVPNCKRDLITLLASLQNTR